MANAPYLALGDNTDQPKEIIQDKYRIRGILGKGSVGITYSAVNLQTESSVAIKVICLKQLKDWKQIELFKREAEVLSKLNHPAIPKYIDYFDIETETDKAFYIVQQQAPGKSLAQLVESGWRTTEAEVKNIAQQLLSILIYLHSLKPPVIHRDIKPNNIIYSDEGKIYLVDFGAVQNTYYNTLMQGSTVVGTYGYMAPEQFRGKAVSATDLYSVGATLLYLLTHRSPAELPQDTLKLDFRNSVAISESFADWLEQMLEPDKEDRFATAEVALSKLFPIKKKSPNKLITSLGIGVLLATGIVGFSFDKWWVLSRLGFYPAELCSPKVWQRFFEQGGSINFINIKDKISILSCTIRYENTEIIKKRLANTKNMTAIINVFNDKNTTLLHEAVIADKYEIVKFLIDMGANVNVKNQSGEPPLFIAKNKDIALLLIKNGADVNVKKKSGITPLFDWLYNKDVAQVLIEHRADINAKNEYGQTPLLRALMTNNKDVAQVLIEYGADVNSKDNWQQIPLFWANNEDVAKLLIEHGAYVNARDNSGKTPLFWAKNKSVAQVLINNGADIHVRDYYGQTPLFDANDKGIAKVLIKNGADVNARDKYSQTPLLDASYRGSIDVAKVLIKNGADVNAQDKSGRTPLSVAVVNFDRKLTNFLIKNGANTNFLNYQNMIKIYNLNLQESQKVREFLEKYQYRK